MSRSVMDVDKYLDDVVGRALRINKQALAFTIPYIISEEYPHMTLMFGDDRQPILCDKNRLWKVVCGRKQFDIAPSFTKGHGRNKEGVDAVTYLKDKGFDGVCFVDFTELDFTQLYWVALDDLPESQNGLYRREVLFE
jgi:hypothetical protein